MKNILVTGATGFVGEFLCKKLLEKTEADLHLLVRGKGGLTPERRSEISFGKNEGWKGRIYVYEGDVTQPELGLQKEDYRHLAEAVDAIYHCAASIRFADPLEVAMGVNHCGTKNIIEFTKSVKNPEFERLNYVSTAYIAGDITEGFSEMDLDRGQGFNNTYEESKFECEKLIEAAMEEGVRITVYRPSIVTGDSRTGETHRNNIIFKFLKVFSMSAIDRFYCTEDSSINLVPIDYVVEAVYCISTDQNCIGRKFHLVNRRNVMVKQMISYLCSRMGVGGPKFCSFDAFTLNGGNPMSYFFEYIRLSHHFSDQSTQVMLEGKIPPAIEMDEVYFDRFLTYCYRESLIRQK